MHKHFLRRMLTILFKTTQELLNIHSSMDHVHSLRADLLVKMLIMS